MNLLLWSGFAFEVDMNCLAMGHEQAARSHADTWWLLDLVGGDWNMTGWIFHSAGNFRIPTDFHIFFRGVGIQPPTRDVLVKSWFFLIRTLQRNDPDVEPWRWPDAFGIPMAMGLAGAGTQKQTCRVYRPKDGPFLVDQHGNMHYTTMIQRWEFSTMEWNRLPHQKPYEICVLRQCPNSCERLQDERSAGGGRHVLFFIFLDDCSLWHKQHLDSTYGGGRRDFSSAFWC